MKLSNKKKGENNMQTFLPYQDFRKSLECLDNKRLGKQRVEAKQLLNIVMGVNKSKGWTNHPAAKMWRGYPKALAIYYNTCLEVWEERGFKNIKLTKIPIIMHSLTPFPEWFGDPDFHASHQSNLLRKNPEHYGKYFDVPNNLPYIWPTGEEK